MRRVRYIGEHTPEQIAHMPFGKALAALHDAEKLPTELPPGGASGLPFVLPIASIVILENVFQHRDRIGNEYDSERHVRELVAALKRKPTGKRFLDPVLVIGIDNAWICVDGHHRLKAYEIAGRTEALAIAFEGSVDGAILAAGISNARTKLPMTNRDRMNAAWKMTASGIASKAQTVEASGVSDGTVAKMRRTKRILTEKGFDPSGLSYDAAVEIERGGAIGGRGLDWKQNLIARFENALSKSLGTKAHRNRELIAEALENRFPSLVETIVERNALEHREAIEQQFLDEDGEPRKPTYS